MIVSLFINALAAVLSTILGIYGGVVLKMGMSFNVTIVKYN